MRSKEMAAELEVEICRSESLGSVSPEIPYNPESPAPLLPPMAALGKTTTTTSTRSKRNLLSNFSRAGTTDVTAIIDEVSSDGDRRRYAS